MSEIRVRLRNASRGTVRADLEVAFAGEGARKPSGLGGALASALSARMRRRGFLGRLGEVLSVEVGAGRDGSVRTVIGLGPAGRIGPEALRRGAAEASREARRLGVSSVALVAPEWARGDDGIRTLVEGFLAGAYRFSAYRTTSGRSDRLRDLTVVHRGVEAAEDAAHRAAVVGRATSLARDLVNEPPSSLPPRELARRAVEAARAAGLSARVLDERAIAAAGMNALLGVSRGSAEPPRVVHLVHRARRRRPGARVALVRKGVTFDSGGLNLKTGSGMATMKADMAGAAAVLAAMTTLPALSCGVEVHGFLGLVENMTGGSAYKPGDVLRSLAGKTIEVADTDAEGRLVLADLFAWAGTTAGPDVMVDVATLTGAVVVALGPLASGLFSPDDDLATALTLAAFAVGERVWRLPLYDDYREDLDSEVADLRNVGDRWGAAITAAVFLREFVPTGVRWAHLDVAGPAFLEKARAGLPVGATGAGVATLARWLEGM